MSNPDRVTLEVSLRPVVRDGRVSVEGEVAAAGQGSRPFVGWMELLGLLERVATSAVNQPAP